MAAASGMDTVATRSGRERSTRSEFFATSYDYARLLSDRRKDRRPPLVLHVEMGRSAAGDLLFRLNLT